MEISNAGEERVPKEASRGRNAGSLPVLVLAQSRE